MLMQGLERPVEEVLQLVNAFAVTAARRPAYDFSLDIGEMPGRLLDKV